MSVHEAVGANSCDFDSTMRVACTARDQESNLPAVMGIAPVRNKLLAPAKLFATYAQQVNPGTLEKICGPSIPRWTASAHVIITFLDNKHTNDDLLLSLQAACCGQLGSKRSQVQS